MQVLPINQKTIESLQFILKTVESYFGSINAAKTYQPHIDEINKAIVDHKELKDPEPEQKE